MDKIDQEPVKLAVDVRDAARMLSISERALWSLTSPRGPVPAVRLGRRVLYSVDSLREFLARQQETSA